MTEKFIFCLISILIRKDMTTLNTNCTVLLPPPCGIQSTSGNDRSADPFQSPLATQRRQKERNSSLELRESSDLVAPSLT